MAAIGAGQTGVCAGSLRDREFFYQGEKISEKSIRNGLIMIK